MNFYSIKDSLNDVSEKIALNVERSEVLLVRPAFENWFEWLVSLDFEKKMRH